MRPGALFTLTLLMAAPLTAAPRKAVSKPPAPAKPAPGQKLMQSCDAHKFETVVDTTVDGQPHKSRVRLCGNEGQGDAEWIGTLRDAIRKLEANDEMAPATRDQIITAIKTEIGRLSIVGPSVPVKREAETATSSPASRDYAVLPPLPAPPAAPPPPAVTPAVPIVSSASPSPPAASAPVRAMPRLTMSCETPAELSGSAPCTEFERETRLTIEADGDVPAGTKLEFIRNGREQGQLALDGLARGAPLRTSLPRSVCAGFGAGKLELRIVRAVGAQPDQAEGPYSLRC